MYVTPPATLHDDDIPTRADLEEAMRNHVAAIRRLPTHWTDHRARWHDKINTLLDEWEIFTE